MLIKLMLKVLKLVLWKISEAPKQKLWQCEVLCLREGPVGIGALLLAWAFTNCRCPLQAFLFHV